MMLKSFLLIFTLLLATNGYSYNSTLSKRALQKAHEKSQAEKWVDAFFDRHTNFNQIPSLVKLIIEVTKIFLSECTPIILYDSVVEASDGLLLEVLFRHFPIAYVHGQISNSYRIKMPKTLKSTENSCVTYILFMADVMRCKDVIGEQVTNKVVIVARSSQWRVYEFLANDVAQEFVNLLVIAQSEKNMIAGEEMPYILYTHKMFIDGLGSGEPQVLTSWTKNNFSRQGINLFPKKITDGFSGHRFIISVANQPPFSVKRGTDVDTDEFTWDGIEVRLIDLLAKAYNFTTDYREPKDVGKLGSGDAVTRDISLKRSNLGIGGIYTTANRIEVVDVSTFHSSDCASFLTLTSTALPRYRAIMGPFHWTVWLSLTIVYLFAIFPLSLTDKHTLRHLLEKPEEIENMFWYVFGTFTNCFTFTGKASWSNSDKVATRVLVGFYWVFTIITTACYTGCIIAFVTLPIFPETVDSTDQLLSGRFQVGTLDKGGWQYFYENSSDPTTKKLLKNIEYLSNIQSGLKNVTKAFFWPYTFLGSRAELDFIIRTNFTTQRKRAVLHISEECFVPYSVAILFPLNSIYKEILNKGISNAVQTGLIIKFARDIDWEIMRSSTGKLLQANVGGTTKLQIEDRALTLDDMQGMFLLLGAGFFFGGFFLLSEVFGGCLNMCKTKLIRRLSTASVDSNPRSHDSPTPRQKLNSIQYSVHTRLCSVPDLETGGLLSADVVLHSELNGTCNGAVDMDEEIDKIFNLDALFGETNNEENEIDAEDLKDLDDTPDDDSFLEKNGSLVEKNGEEVVDTDINFVGDNDVEKELEEIFENDKGVGDETYSENNDLELLFDHAK